MQGQSVSRQEGRPTHVRTHIEICIITIKLESLSASDLLQEDDIQVVHSQKLPEHGDLGARGKAIQVHSREGYDLHLEHRGAA
jgi:hypothetical protein